MTFSDYIKTYSINHESDFPAIAQAIIATRYAVPYPGENDQRQEGKINRRYHGGFHAVSSVVNLLMLMDLYRKYHPELLVSPNNKPLNLREIKLLMLAVLCHDAANTSEITGSQTEQANLFQQDMLDLGFLEDEITPFSKALRDKDISSQQNDIYTALIHDADCFDYLRLLTELSDFKRHYLYIYSRFHEYPGFLEELETIIKNLFNILRIQNNGELTDFHKRCEQANNCYSEFLNGRFEQTLDHYLFQRIIMDRSQIQILDLYTYDPHSLPKLASDADEENQINQTLHIIRDHGCYIRVIKKNDIKNELHILEKNTHALNRENIHTVESLREYILKQDNKEHVKAPLDFFWRPCSYYEFGLPLRLYNHDYIILLIDPRPKNGTLASFFYKQNACSDSASLNIFKYNNKVGPLKDRITLENLRRKLHEMNDRRCGATSDLNLHYYGKPMLNWPEILIHNTRESIIGIAIPEGKQLAKDALFARNVLGTNCPIFSFSETKDLQAIKNEEITSELCISTLEEHLVQINHKFSTENCEAFSLTTSTSYYPYVDEINLPCIQLDLSCDVNKVKPEFRIRIIAAIYDLLKFKPASINDAKIIIDLTVTKSQNNVLIASMLSLVDMETDLRIFANDGLKSIQEAALSSTNMSESSLQKELIDGVIVEKIGDISCPVTLHDISKNNPLNFTFFHPVNPDIFCVARIVKSKPYIEFKLQDNRSFLAETTLLPDIAQKYYQQRVRMINNLFLHGNVLKALSERGIDFISIKLKVIQNKLILEFQIRGNGDKSLLVHELLNLKNHNKFKIKQIDQGYDIYEVPYVQNIDYIFDHPLLLDQLHKEFNSPRLKRDVLGLFSNSTKESPNLNMTSAISQSPQRGATLPDDPQNDNCNNNSFKSQEDNVKRRKTQN